MGMPGDHGRQGFSLVEFVVAVAIVGIGVVPLLSAYYFSWKSTREAERKSQAVMLGRWKMERLRSTQGYALQNNQDRISNGGNCFQFLPEQFRNTNASLEKGEFECSVRVRTLSSPPRRLVELRVFYVSPFGGERTISCREPASCDRVDFVSYFTPKSPPPP